MPFWKKWLGGAKADAVDTAVHDSGRCDVCPRERPRGTGYLLTTAEVTRTPGYWAERIWPRLSELTGSLRGERPGATAFLNLVQRFTSSATVWLVCDDCIGLFSVDRAACRRYAERRFKRSSFAPPGSGAVPLWAACLGDLAAFGPEVGPLAAACVLFGIRGSVSRKPGRAAKHFKAIDAAVLDQKDLDDIWAILLGEGKCLVDLDLSAFPNVVERLWAPAGATLQAGVPAPRLVPARTGAVGEFGSCFLFADVLRLELACRGCKRSPAKAVSIDAAIAEGRCEWCQSRKAYLYVART
jgi:hypothetical protein